MMRNEARRTVVHQNQLQFLGILDGLVAERVVNNYR